MDAIAARPALAPALPFEADLLRRALAGQLDNQEAAHLVCRLLQLYPPHRPSALSSPKP
jgi:hypothetical protein